MVRRQVFYFSHFGLKYKYALDGLLCQFPIVGMPAGGCDMLRKIIAALVMGLFLTVPAVYAADTGDQSGGSSAGTSSTGTKSDTGEKKATKKHKKHKKSKKAMKNATSTSGGTSGGTTGGGGK
jgi:hypothetical protein